MASENERIQVRVCAVVLRNESRPDAEILVIRHQRQGRRYFVLPGGKVESGETLAAALHREIHEETGLNIAMDGLLLMADFVDEAHSRTVLNLVFRASVSGGEFVADMRNSPEAGEKLDVAYFVPLADLHTLDFYPRITSELRDALKKCYYVPPVYLGNVWDDLDDSEELFSGRGA